MKTRTLLLLAALLCGIVTITVLAQVTRFTWLFHDKPVYQLQCDGERLEFGLRDDGVVIWRKITNTTNSPAEIGPATNWLWMATNITLTNITWTNIIIRPDSTNYLFPTGITLTANP